MEEAEYEVAATAGGTRDVPWGGAASDVDTWEIGPVGTPGSLDVIHYDLDVFGLYSNAVEWTGTWGVYYPRYESLTPAFSPKDFRVLRGGMLAGVTNREFPQAGAPKDPDPRSIWNKGPRARETRPVVGLFPVLGFRCARSSKPRLDPDDFVTIIGK
jgi:formylglycine-generating enzyme required for sulfatase activity